MTRPNKRTEKLLDELLEEMDSVAEQIENEERHEVNLKAAKEIKAIYDSYKEVGFNDEEAFTLLVTMLEKVTLVPTT